MLNIFCEQSCIKDRVKEPHQGQSWFWRGLFLLKWSVGSQMYNTHGVLCWLILWLVGFRTFCRYFVLKSDIHTWSQAKHMIIQFLPRFFFTEVWMVMPYNVLKGWCTMYFILKRLNKNLSTQCFYQNTQLLCLRMQLGFCSDMLGLNSKRVKFCLVCIYLIKYFLHYFQTCQNILLSLL